MNTNEYHFQQIIQPYVTRYRMSHKETIKSDDDVIRYEVSIQFMDDSTRTVSDINFTIFLDIDMSNFYIASYYGYEMGEALGYCYNAYLPIDKLSMVLYSIIAYFDVLLQPEIL